MPKTMRQQTLARKKSFERAETRRLAKQKAVTLLKTSSLPIRKISDATGLSKSTVGSLKDMIAKDRHDFIQAILEDPGRSRPGRNPVLSAEEEHLICDRMIYAANKGFVMDNNGLRQLMSKVAKDGRDKGWKNALPSQAAVRAFRARNRQITYRTSESKDNAKFRGNDYNHVKGYFDVLNQVNSRHPGILLDGERIWNIDETAVDATFGERIKVFGSSNTHHGGFRKAQKTAGIAKHITAVVAISASGHKTPPFFTVAGKYVMSNWFEPLPDVYGGSEICKPFCRPNWFPKDGVVKCSEKGSMEIDLLPAFMKHLNRYVRTIVPENQHYIVCMDDHSSRNGHEWLEYCVKNNCEVVLSPANTSHFLQPCDQRVNKRFKKAMRAIRDEFHKSVVADTRNVRFNLICGVHAFGQISTTDITQSFAQSGLFPFDYAFPERFMTNANRIQKNVDEQVSLVAQAGGSQAVRQLFVRRNDEETVNRIKNLFRESNGASTILKEVAMLVRNGETVNEIIMNTATSATASTAESSNNRKICNSTAELLQNV